jgi:hypothetical protein
MRDVKSRAIVKVKNIYFVPGFCECAIFENAANSDKPSNTVKPKNTTAFNRTHRVCIFDFIYLMLLELYLILSLQ